jgi:type II secretory pathway pseudopilin PulG
MELLTVMAIIGILVALLMPAVAAARQKAREARARTVVTGLNTAFRAYYTEYGKWPTSSSGAQDVTTNLFANSRGITFYEFPAKDMIGNKFKDPWGNIYRCSFDTDYDNATDNPFGSGSIATGCLVWSKGYDGRSSDDGGTSGNDADNILSW